MPHTAVVTFTARPLPWILQDGGSRDWRLDADRARKMEYLVCTQNCHNPDFGAPDAPHRSAFLIGRISDVVPSPFEPGRWLIKISEYTIPTPPIPNIWGKSGHLRYPIWYTTLEELGIDLSGLPPFSPMARAVGAEGMSEVPTLSIMAPANWKPRSASRGEAVEDRFASLQSASDQDMWRRLDAVLDQIDRIPDLPAPFDPLDWDEHGLPR